MICDYQELAIPIFKAIRSMFRLSALSPYPLLAYSCEPVVYNAAKAKCMERHAGPRCEEAFISLLG
jgi:hypothetical protein